MSKTNPNTNRCWTQMLLKSRRWKYNTKRKSTKSGYTKPITENCTKKYKSGCTKPITEKSTKKYNSNNSKQKNLLWIQNITRTTSLQINDIKTYRMTDNSKTKQSTRNSKTPTQKQNYQSGTLRCQLQTKKSISNIKMPTSSKAFNQEN